MTSILAAAYMLSVAGMALFGAMGFLTLWLYWRHRHATFPLPNVTAEELPAVTVQLPIYNESMVVERLIRAAAGINYPRDRLEIQVIDDSTDDTTEKALLLVEQFRAQGVNIHLLHRKDRSGYKAGALSAALPHARSEFVAIFDADFQPDPDFLLRTVPYFLADERLGVIQTRWGHLNSRDSALTAAQAIALDKHFVIEQTVRHRANLFPKFNGSAGIWRRACLEGSGGWQDDTLCEDLCLSTRAVLQGWRFLFLNDVVAPAELPSSVLAYKNQQARWACGSTQCLVKYGLPILRARQHPLPARLYALLSMSAYTTHILLIVLLLLQTPMLLLGYRFPMWLMVFSIAGLGQPLLFLLAQQFLHRDWPRRLRHFPALLLVAVGTAPSNTRAIVRALFGGRQTFVRTPKGKRNPYRLRPDFTLWLEIALALYAAFGLIIALRMGNPGPLFLLTTCCLGFTYVSILSLRERGK